jgi:hypothetical protein
MRKKLFMMVLIVFSMKVYAENKPIQIALFTPLQIFPEETSITGVRWNVLYGKNSSVTGLDFGLVNRTTEKMSVGVQFGIMGFADRGWTGLQGNFVNVTRNEFKGIQFGFLNYAEDANGVMIGIINYARRLYGLQIGLFNLIEAGGVAPVMPIVNWAF